MNVRSQTLPRLPPCAQEARHPRFVAHATPGPRKHFVPQEVMKKIKLNRFIISQLLLLIHLMARPRDIGASGASLHGVPEPNTWHSCKGIASTLQIFNSSPCSRQIVASISSTSCRVLLCRIGLSELEGAQIVRNLLQYSFAGCERIEGLIRAHYIHFPYKDRYGSSKALSGHACGHRMHTGSNCGIFRCSNGKSDLPLRHRRRQRSVLTNYLCLLLCDVSILQ